jgi:hypothetical protein
MKLIESKRLGLHSMGWWIRGFGSPVLFDMNIKTFRPESYVYWQAYGDYLAWLEDWI